VVSRSVKRHRCCGRVAYGGWQASNACIRRRPSEQRYKQLEKAYLAEKAGTSRLLPRRIAGLAAPRQVVRRAAATPSMLRQRRYRRNRHQSPATGTSFLNQQTRVPRQLAMPVPQNQGKSAA